MKKNVSLSTYNVEKNLSFQNGISLWFIIYFVFGISIFGLMFTKDYQQHAPLWFMIVFYGFFLLIWLYAIIQEHYISKCNYSIFENNLYINEFLPYKENHICLPIKDISKIRWKHATRMFMDSIEIYIGDESIVLNATTCKKELYNTLSQYIDKENKD